MVHPTLRHTLFVFLFALAPLLAHGDAASCTSTTCSPWYTGGTVTISGEYRIHTFTSSGTLTAVSPGIVEYLVVGGGGGGGRGAPDLAKVGGGGGAGGFLSGSMTISTSQTITVGAGGAGGGGQGKNGASSRIGSLVSAAGGGGGGHGVDSAFSNRNGRNGASGGGAAVAHNPTASGAPGSGTSGQGHAGGSGNASNQNEYVSGGGGGGAGAAGASGTSKYSAGAGGLGKSSSISGSTKWYAGGGGGAKSTGGTGGTGGQGGGGAGGLNSAGLDATANTGGGGGGGGGYWSGAHNGGKGGSGIVIVRYKPVINPPTCSITLSPTTVNQGESAILSWSSQNASTLYIQNVGYVPGSGSTTVSPSGTVTYSGTAANASGTTTCSGNTAPAGRLTVNQSCALPWGGSITHGQSTTTFQSATVAYNQSCASITQTRTCNNGALSGSYQYGSCTVAEPLSCTLGGITIPHDTSRTFYSVQTAPPGQTCTGQGGSSSYAQSRVCTNGNLSGSDSYQYASCSCAPQYYCSDSVVMRTDASCATHTVTTCTAPLFCSTGSAVCMSPVPEFVPFAGGSGHLQTRPLVVRSSLTSRIFWNVGNVQSCAVEGSNGDSWNGLSSGDSGVETSPIVHQTAYTLSCVPLEGGSFSPETVFVNVIPIFQER